MGPEKDFFIQIINTGIETLEKYLDNLLTVKFSDPMQSIKWESMNDVGDTSKFVINT